MNPPRTSSLPRPQDATPVQRAGIGIATGNDVLQAAPAQPPAPARTAETTSAGADVLSDKATAAFIRRTLCAQYTLSSDRGTPKPVDELLPPLTSSNEVDLQLYAILAVILREFVYAWYAKITPDHVFVDEVIHIIAHCTRALEQRLRKADLEAILLDEIPQVVDTHVKAFRIAHESVYPPPLGLTPREIYHNLVPHPALSPVPRETSPSSSFEQARNEESWRQLLVQGALAVLLPTEDLENGCLSALVSEIFSEMILGNGVSGKACEPWLLWDAITTVIEALQPRTLEHVEKPTTAASRLEHFGLVSHGKESGSIDQHANLNGPGAAASRSTSGMLWMMVSVIFMAFTAARAVVYTIATASSQPARSKTWLTTQPPQQAESTDASASIQESMQSDDLRPILSMSVWSLTGRTLDLDLRMPWISGLFAFSHHMAMFGPGRVGSTDGALDRYLSSKIRTHLLNPAYVPKLLKVIRATLFPNNAPGPPKRVPDAAEIVAIKRRCAVTILSALPGIVVQRYFGKDAEPLVEVEGMLDLLGDAYLNKHLVFNIIELLVVRLMPEMGGKGVSELVRERIGEVK